jgi:hypothetical protein
MVSTGFGRDKVKRAQSRPAIAGETSCSRRAMVRAAALLVLGLAGAAVGCRPDRGTPRGAAEAFLDAHYVHIDLPAAHELTDGLARHKVEQEMELVAGQTIDETTRKPTVHYRLLEEHPQEGDAVNYLYQANITVEDADRFERRWLITVRRQEAGWRVTNYQELEAPS